MDSIIRNVVDLDPAGKEALESVLGVHLSDQQQVIVQIVERAPPVANDLHVPPGLPEWCKVFAGLSDADVAAIERAALTRANLSRAVE